MTELLSIRCTELSCRLYSRSTMSVRSSRQGLYQRCLLPRRGMDRNSHCCHVMKKNNRIIVNGNTRRGIQKLLGGHNIDQVPFAMYMSKGLTCRAGESELAVEMSDSGGDVTVEIRLHGKHVEFGQAVALLGSGEALGNWAPDCSIPLVWTEGDVWIGQVTVPKDSEAEFKYIVVVKDDETEVVEWEECNNRVLGLSGVEKVSCWWNDESRIELVSKEPTGVKNGSETKKKRTKSTKKPKVKSTKAKEQEDVVHEEKESLGSAEHHAPEPDVAMPSSNDDIMRDVVEEDVEKENEEVVTYNFDDGASSESASELAKRLLQNEKND